MAVVEELCGTWEWEPVLESDRGLFLKKSQFGH